MPEVARESYYLAGIPQGIDLGCSGPVFSLLRRYSSSGSLATPRPNLLHDLPLAAIRAWLYPQRPNIALRTT